MDLLNKLTIKNLELNKKRTIVTIIGIILSIALISAVSYMFYSFQYTLVTYEKNENGNFHVIFNNVKKEDAIKFTNNSKIEGTYFVDNLGYANLTESKNEYKPYVYLTAFSSSSFANLAIKLSSGRLPQNSSEIVIPSHLETNGKVKLNVGDYITLEVGKRVDQDGNILKQSDSFDPENGIEENIIDTETKTFKIVGIINRPSMRIEEFSAPGYTFITYLGDIKNAHDLTAFVRYNKSGLKNLYKVTAGIMGIDTEKYDKYQRGEYIASTEFDSLKEELDKSPYYVRYNDYLITTEAGITNNGTLKSLGVVCIIVIIIIIVTSVFCIKNSFDISITEKIRQYGMLSSIGATSKQIKKNVYFEAFILGCIGIPLGIFSGLLAAYILLKISNILLGDMVNIPLYFKFSFIPIIISLTLGFVTIFLSARKSAKKASKISPITAIRNSEDIKLNAKKLKTPKIINNWFGIGGEISYKNLKRSKKKYRTTVISIITCVSVFVSLSYFINLAFRTIKLELNTTPYDINIYYNKDNNEGIEDKIKELLQSDKIEEYSYVLNEYYLQHNDESKYTKEYKDIYDVSDNYVSIIILDDNSFKNYAQTINYNIEDIRGAILINKAYIRTDHGSKDKEKIHELPIYTYKKGDSIKLIKKANKEEITYTFPLDYITDKLPYGYYETYSNAYMVVNEIYLKEFDNYNHYNQLYIKTKYNDELVKEIDEVLKGYNYNVHNTTEEARAMRSVIALVSIFLYGFITVIALIGITNIFNTINTNMNLRRREFAMLQSIGMTKREFNRMIRLESLFYGTKSLLIGIPIGILISILLHNVMLQGEYALRYELPLIPIIITCLTVFFLLFVIMKYSLNKIKKQNIIETIRNENI